MLAYRNFVFLKFSHKTNQLGIQRERGVHILFNAENLFDGLVECVFLINVDYRQRMSRLRQIINRNVWFLGIAIKQICKLMLHGLIVGVICSAC